MAEAGPKDFFISYNQADKAWAEWIAWELEEAGYKVILQAWDFHAGGNFVLEMQRAAELSDHTIAVLSPDYLTALYTQPEWAAAFAHDPTGEKGTLIPVRVKKCELKGLLKPIIYIDLFDQPEENAARNTLLTGVKRERRKPSSPPPFPGAIARQIIEKPRFPGTLSPIWNVPHPRNPNFTGRDKLLEDLHESLTSGQTTALTQAALHGLGGVGKTQLALEYAYRFAPDYDLVWWVRSEDPVGLGAEYAALAGALDLPEKGAADQEAQLAAVRRCLGQRGKWLLIFDNAGEPQDLKSYIPPGGGGHVLITSRNPVWRGLARPLDVRVWDRPESVAFLLKRTGREKEPIPEDEAAAAALAQELGDLPLALEQAGAYIDECSCSIAHYLGLFRSRHKEMLRRGKSSQEYPDTVATTWELSFQKVNETSSAAADLLNLCAFLAPDDMPRELLEQGVPDLPKPLARAVQDPVKFDKVLAILRRYSLMEVTGDALAVHRLVQAVVRDRLDKKGKEQWAGAAVEVVNAAFPNDIQTNVGVWPWCARFLPHALAAASHAQDMRVAPAAAGGLLNHAAIYLWTRAEFNGAMRLMQQALTLVEAAYGPNYPNVASIVNNLGSVLRAQGDLRGAKAHYERALAIDEAVYGPNHPEVATDVNNLGSVLQALGDLAGAKAHYERALTIDEAAYGPDHPEVATAVNNLGDVLQALGDLEGAKAHYERALAIDEAAYGPNHPKVAIRVNNLGSVLRDLGNLAGARANFERALAIWEKAHGPNHPQVATAVNNLGSVLRALGDLEGAKARLERALAISEAVYGPDHPDVAIKVSNLGSVLRALGDLAGAKAYCERALAIDEATYGPYHPEVATDVNNLGSVLQDLGDLPGAKAHFKRALAICRQFFGEDHPNTNLVKRNLAALGLPGD